MMNRKKMMYAFLLMLISGNYALGMADMANEMFIDAVREGNIERVQDAINAGADINVQDEYGDTALMVAVVSRKLHVVQLLLDRGADIHIQNNYGQTAFMLSLMKGELGIAQLLLDRGAAIDINVQDEYGSTALMFAARTGRLDVIQLLLDRGADVHIQDNQGQTALDYNSWDNNVCNYLQAASSDYILK